MIRVLWRIIDGYILLVLIVLLKIFQVLSSFLGKRRRGGPVKPEKILLIKLSALGDTVMMTPILRNLRERLPHAEIIMLVTRLNAGAVKHCPYVNRLVFLDLYNPLRFLRTIGVLRRIKFNYIIDFEQKIRVTSLISYFLKAQETRGFQTPNSYRHFLYNKTVTHRFDCHQFDCMADLVREISGPVEDRRTEFWVSADEEGWADDYLKNYKLQAKHFVILHPCCGAEYLPGARAREWPLEYYASLGDFISQAYGFTVVISGSVSEQKRAERFKSLMANGALNIAGKTSIGQLAALLKRSRLLICADTGIMHVGTALGVKTLALFGPNTPFRCQPLSGEFVIEKSNLPCMPCVGFGSDKPGCSKFSCMRSLPVEKVKQQVMGMLKT